VLVVRGETTRQTFAVAAGKLRITVRDADGRPAAGLQVRVHGIAEDCFLPPTDADGMIDGELTAETVALRVLPRALASPQAQSKCLQQGGGGRRRRSVRGAVGRMGAAVPEVADGPRTEVC
jgi:hypothetical protein